MRTVWPIPRPSVGPDQTANGYLSDLDFGYLMEASAVFGGCFGTLLQKQPQVRFDDQTQLIHHSERVRPKSALASEFFEFHAFRL